jgi:hypothetical protein
MECCILWLPPRDLALTARLECNNVTQDAQQSAVAWAYTHSNPFEIDDAHGMQ